MLTYLVVILDDSCPSFCHYQTGNRLSNLIKLEDLSKAIRFALLENLYIQFVYPRNELPKEYLDLIDSVDHVDIKANENSDITIYDSINSFLKSHKKNSVSTILTNRDELFDKTINLRQLLQGIDRLNIVLQDIEQFSTSDFARYKDLLISWNTVLESFYIEGKTPQVNLLTDRLMLEGMKNCGAGDSSLTIAPNGKFYLCPAFYYSNDEDSVGDIDNGIDIKNKQLYKLSYAPICRKCDAYQCKRCIWLNKKMTLEVNTPSHEQCVAAHLERNASRQLLYSVRKKGIFFPNIEIDEIDYLDPFDKK